MAVNSLGFRTAISARRMTPRFVSHDGDEVALADLDEAANPRSSRAAGRAYVSDDRSSAWARRRWSCLPFSRVARRRSS
jgi:hypothetical protein